MSVDVNGEPPGKCERLDKLVWSDREGLKPGALWNVRDAHDGAVTSEAHAALDDRRGSGLVREHAAHNGRDSRPRVRTRRSAFEGLRSAERPLALGSAPPDDHHAAGRMVGELARHAAE